MSVSQKQLLAAVALSLGAAGVAQAQSSVSAYGILDLSFGSFQYAGLDNSADNSSTTRVESGQMTTSFIGFKGTEDLGGGLKALFTLESFMRLDTGASGRSNTDVFWARAANVGLSGGFGKAVIGRMDNFLYQQALAFNPFGGSFGFSPTIRLTYGKWGPDKGDSGWSNSIAYYTPNLSGFTAAVQVQPGESQTESTSTGVMAGYANGPFAIGFGYQVAKSAEAPKADLNDGAKQTFGLLGASYDFGAVKLFGQYGQYKGSGFTGTTAATDNVKTKLYQLGLSVPVSADGKVLASYGSQTRELTTGDAKHEILTLGYDHFLSKRTDVYAVFMRDDDDRDGYKAGNTVAFGIRHRF
ncbi:porin [Aquabacterium soli]|nr:porin [Aquabacterium soli]